MKNILLLFVYFSSLIIYSQDNLMEDYFNLTAIDSVQLIVWKVNNKETASIGDIKSKEYKKELKRIILNKKDESFFIKKIKNLSSYNNSRALLHHFNLEFLMYSKGVVSTEINCSTLTSNIDIKNKFTGYLLEDNYSLKMKKVLMRLLKKNDLFKLTYFSE